ncbi:hypothetical protein JTB14_019968 [Gonioctena quinquepunctata]|nr:hypothetical protein JTB14_019968 [Gonioctena quinquepunctata]
MASDPIEVLIKEEPQDPDLLAQNIPTVIKQENDLDFLLDKPDLINVENTPVIDEPNTWVEASVEADNEPSEDASDKDYDPPTMDEPSHKITLESLQYSSSQGDESSSSSGDESDSDLKCKICKEEFDDDYYLQQHYKSRRLAEKSYKCCGCGKLFRDNTQLNVHARKHTGEQPYSCKTCGKRFSVNGNLSKHMRIHTGERRFTCDTCDRKFTQFAHLEDHMKTHSGERPFVCDFCNSSFKTKARLKKHKKSHDDTTDNRRAIPCPICSRVMKSTKQLMTHLETHDEGPHNPFSCDYCGKSYKNLFSLNIHIKLHGNVRDFKCSLCDKAFTNASHLRRHSNSHSGVRPFVCNICHRGFPSAQNLKRHMMTHTGEKPYTCTDCSRSFLTLENLNRHRRTHTGEKPFPCEVCGKFFAHSTTAKEHMRVHTGDKPFQCEFCDKKFSLSKTRYKHIREKHPAFFPEFKRLNDMPPNMKRAREKIKKEVVLPDEPYVKKIIMNYSNHLKGIAQNGARVGGKEDGMVGPVVQKCEDVEDIKVNMDTVENSLDNSRTEEVRVKEEPMAVFIKTESDDFDCS